MDLALPTPDDTDAFAARLAASQTSPAFLWLRGDLGAGKSAFARAYLRALGVTGAIKSPTYTLVELYDLSGGRQAAHLDLYRLAGPDDLEFLGLPDRRQLWVALIEWPEHGALALGDADLVIQLDVDGRGRRARLEARNEDARIWIERAGFKD